MDNCLLIFLKNPEVGKVKTRLAREIGAERATRLYRLFVEATLVRTRDSGGHYGQVFFYTPAEQESRVRGLLAGFLTQGRFAAPVLYPQIGADLGERMFNALGTAYSIGAKRAVIIGTDSPTLDKEIIDEAFHLLQNNDVVTGPAVDGGYYLIGASLPACGGFFTGVDWGGNRVFEQTVGRLKEEGARYAIAPVHYDVDNLEDLRTLKQEIVRVDDIKRGNLLDIYRMLVDELRI